MKYRFSGDPGGLEVVDLERLEPPASARSANAFSSAGGSVIAIPIESFDREGMDVTARSGVVNFEW